MTLRNAFGVFLLLATNFSLVARAQRPVPPKVATPAANKEAVHIVPAGTLFYLSLKTPVSTTTSNLYQEVTAEFERSLRCPAGVVIPVGALMQGRIEKLIPSSSPTDRAKLLLVFNTLELPGQFPIRVVGHVKEVDNARESVVANGTIVGILASELPVTLLNSAVRKIGKATSGGADQSPQSRGTLLGSSDTSIDYGVRTEFSFLLDKPLRVSGTYQPEFAQQIPAALKETVVRILGNSPNRVVSKKGTLGGAVNLVLIGSQEEIRAAFMKARWTEAKEEKGGALWKTFEAVINGRGYDAAPMSTLYLFGRSEDMAFEKMLNTFAMRHHLRIWKAPGIASDGREIWLVAADHDNGIDIHPGVISHATDPHVDAEREKVGADLGMTGLVKAEELVTPPHPLHAGFTATGGAWETDGKVLVIDLKAQYGKP